MQIRKNLISLFLALLIFLPGLDPLSGAGACRHGDLCPMKKDETVCKLHQEEPHGHHQAVSCRNFIECSGNDSLDILKMKDVPLLSNKAVSEIDLNGPALEPQAQSAYVSFDLDIRDRPPSVLLS